MLPIARQNRTRRRPAPVKTAVAERTVREPGRALVPLFPTRRCLTAAEMAAAAAAHSAYGRVSIDDVRRPRLNLIA